MKSETAWRAVLADLSPDARAAALEMLLASSADDAPLTNDGSASAESLPSETFELKKKIRQEAIELFETHLGELGGTLEGMGMYSWTNRSNAFKAAIFAGWIASPVTSHELVKSGGDEFHRYLYNGRDIADIAAETGIVATVGIAAISRWIKYLSVKKV